MSVITFEMLLQKRSKAAKKLADAVRKQNDNPLLLMLTGTPVVNRPSDIINPLKIMGRLNEFGGWLKFVRRYCQAYRDRFGWHIDGGSNLDELNSKLRSSCYIRRTKEQVLLDLPPLTWVDITISEEEIKDTKMVTNYNRAQKDVVRYLEDEAQKMQIDIDSIVEEDENARDDLHRALAANSAKHLVRMQVLRDIANSLKMPIMQQWIKDFLQTGEKLIVFAHHTDVIEALVSDFENDFGAVAIYGKTSYEEKMRNVDSFQDVNSSTKLIICSLRGASVGVELTAASNILFFEQDWSPAIMDQAASRSHRGGQTLPVTLWVPMVQNTVDEEIAKAINRKRRQLKEVSDGTTGNATSSSVLADVVFSMIKMSDDET